MAKGRYKNLRFDFADTIKDLNRLEGMTPEIRREGLRAAGDLLREWAYIHTVNWPAVDTGALSQGWRARIGPVSRDTDKLTLYNNMWYLIHVEFGYGSMPPRPILRYTFDNHKQDAVEEIVKVVKDRLR